MGIDDSGQVDLFRVTLRFEDRKYSARNLSANLSVF